MKILLLSKSTNKNFINSHLPWLKYFLLITLKSDLCSKDSCIFHTKLLDKRAGLTVCTIPLRRAFVAILLYISIKRKK
jgi:hypothetical protein